MRYLFALALVVLALILPGVQASDLCPRNLCGDNPGGGHVICVGAVVVEACSCTGELPLELGQCVQAPWMKVS